MKHSKINELSDFEDEDFLKYREMFEENNTVLGYPSRNRKIWEMVMAVRGLDAFGALGPEAEILGIGAAKEETISVLSHKAKRVFATDLYLTPGSWGEWLPGRLLIDPRIDLPGTNRNRVVFQHADGTDLPYDDNSFDGIFSSSSIEHFGDERKIRKAIEEACRVLKPGGVASISTEYKLGGPGEGWDNVQVFDEDRINRVWLDGIDWKLSDSIDYVPLDDVPDIDFIRSINDRRYAETQEPHLTLNNGVYRWTSIHFTLIKD